MNHKKCLRRQLSKNNKKNFNRNEVTRNASIQQNHKCLIFFDNIVDDEQNGLLF